MKELETQSLYHDKQLDINSRRWIICSAGCLVDNKFYFSPFGFNGLYLYDFNTSKIVFIGKFPNERNGEWRLHGKAIAVRNKIYFLPDRSQYIHVYNMETNEITAISAEEDGRIEVNNAVLVEEKIYFVSRAETLKLCKLNVTTDELEKYEVKVDPETTITDFAVWENKLIFSLEKKNILIMFSFIEDTTEYYEIPEAPNGIGTMCLKGDDLWMSTEDKVVKWNLKTRKMMEMINIKSYTAMLIREGDVISEYAEFPLHLYGKEMPYNFSLLVKNDLYLFPRRAKNILKIDTETLTITEIIDREDNENENSLNRAERITHFHYFRTYSDECREIITSTCSKNTYIWDKECEYQTKKKIILADLGVEFIDHFCEKNMYSEQKDVLLTDLIDKVVQL